MEEKLELESGQGILLRSLEKSGIPLPKGVCSIQTLTQTPGAFFSICIQLLHKIIINEEEHNLDRSSSLYLQTAMRRMEEENDIAMADKVNMCTQMSASIEKLGGGPVSFHQLLYPSEEDLYNLLRFLVERLSHTLSKTKDRDIPSSFARENTRQARGEEGNLKQHPLADLTLNIHTSAASTPTFDRAPNQQLTDLQTVALTAATQDLSISVLPQRLGEPVASEHVANESGVLESPREDEPWTLKDVKSVANEQISQCSSVTHASGNKESIKFNHDRSLHEKLAFLREQSSEMRNEIGKFQSQGKMLQQELTIKALESQHLESKYELLKAAVQMAFHDQHPIDFNTKELNELVGAEKQNLEELELHQNNSVESLEEKQSILEELLRAEKPEMELDLQKVKEVELETEAIILEIQKRKEECSKLSTELEKRPKAASRKSYIQRISEITKNSRKQDADIERILKDTRDLQIERNSIQESLHRTYAVADETMSRDVNKDPARQKAYGLLTTIHERFGQISEKILVTDRIRREVVEQEAKVASLSARNLNVDELQADLDRMRKENELLEKQHYDHSSL